MYNKKKKEKITLFYICFKECKFSSDGKLRTILQNKITIGRSVCTICEQMQRSCTTEKMNEDSFTCQSNKKYRPYVCQGPREKQPPERLINFGYDRLKCEVQASSLYPGV